MNPLHTIHLTSVDELQAAAPAWDDLWQRSHTVVPLARADLLADWMRQFQPKGPFHAIVVAEGPQWIAAIPLVAHRMGGFLSAAGLPGNCWAPCGDLLCDAAADADAVMHALVAALGDLSWRLFQFCEARIDSPPWQALERVCDRSGLACESHESFRVGRLAIDCPWKDYQKRWAKNHRQALSRALRRMAAEGAVEFEMLSNPNPQAVEPWLREAFRVEDLSWKGKAGTSVLRMPGMYDFFVRQAGQLARREHLELAALRLDGRMIAFVYGFRAKGVYFAHKIGYDPRFAAFSPGQMLFSWILERLFHDGATRALDFMGPVTDAIARWRPDTYSAGRLTISRGGQVGRAMMFAYRNLWRPLRQWRARC